MVRIAAAAIALAASLVGLSAQGSHPIQLLEFSSPTCGPCRQMEPLIQAYEKQGYPIRKIDTSQEPEVARQFGIIKVPCFVMLVEGQEVSRVVGTVDSAQLQQIFQRAKDVYVSRHPRKNPQPEPSAPEVSLAGGSSAELPADRSSIQETDWSADTNSTPRDSDPDIASALVNATVRIRVEDSQGLSFATGTIIDARQGEALIITCGHLFRESKGQGPVQVELFDATPTGVRVVGQLAGEVITYDLDRDVGLVSIRPGRPVTVAPIAPRNSAVARGDRVLSIGCSNGEDPTVLTSRLTSLDRYQGPPNIEASGAPAVGRSGGGLFNDKGELIGVCFSADYEGNEGLYAALESIHDEVERLRLTTVTNNASLADTGAAQLPSPPPLNTSGGPLVRAQGGQDTAAVSLPPPERVPPTSPAVTTIGPNNLPSPPNSLNRTEQAAWDEIMSRAVEHEVIVIVRPIEPGGASEVFTLDRVSPEFARALAGRQRNPQAPATR